MPAPPQAQARVQAQNGGKLRVPSGLENPVAQIGHDVLVLELAPVGKKSPARLDKPLLREPAQGSANGRDALADLGANLAHRNHARRGNASGASEQEKDLELRLVDAHAELLGRANTLCHAGGTFLVQATTASE